MRKLLQFIFLTLVLCSAYSQERNNRINLTLGMMIGRQDSEINGDKKPLIPINFNTGVEYMRIFGTGWIVGGSAQIGYTFDTWSRTVSVGYLTKTISYEVSGAAFGFAPVVGRAWGDNKNIQLLLYPIMIDYISFSRASVDSVKTDISESATQYKTGLRMNLQWGSRLVRNGFYVGTNIVWYTTGWLTNSFGVEFPLGYKLTFGF